MAESNALVIIEKAVAETFGSYKDQIKELKDEGLKTVFDYEDPKGNKEARQFVYKYRQMKGAISKAHKEGKAQYTKITKAFDAEKTALTAECDIVIDFHNAPLKEAKEKSDAAEAAAKLEAEQAEWDAAVIVDYAQAFDDATAYNDLFDREKTLHIKEEAMARKEAEEAARVERAEADRVAKEKAEAEAIAAEKKSAREAKEKAEYEEKMKAEAAAKAKADAEAKALADKKLEKFLTDFDTALAMNATFDLKREAIRREHDRLEAEAAAIYEAEEAKRKAEEKRLSDIKDAEDKAEKEAARVEAAGRAEIARLNKLEKERLEKEAADVAEQRRRDDDRAHRGAVNKAIAEHLAMVTGCDSEKAQAFVKAVLLGEVDHIKITY